MKKFALTIAAFFILLIPIFLIIMQQKHHEKQAPAIMLEAFNATGARIVSSEIYVRSELDGEKYDDGELRLSLLKDLVTGAGGLINGDLPVSHIETDIARGTETEYIINENARILISILKDKQSKKPDKYHLSVSLADTSDRPALSESVAGLKEIFNKYNISPDVNISITGTLEGKLADSEIENLCAKVFESMDANGVEGIKDSGLISVTAFSPSIENSIRVNGRRVNVNMAARYNSYEGKTYIWLATPVITTEY